MNKSSSHVGAATLVHEASTAHAETFSERYMRELTLRLEAAPERGSAAVLDTIADEMKNKRFP